MYKLRYRITTLSQVVISAKHGDMNMVGTEKYIPGTTVLGILAGKFLSEKKLGKAHENEDFFNWFLADSLRISPAFIYHIYKGNVERLFFPVPFSIQRKKDDKTIVDRLFMEEDFDEQMQAINTFCCLEGSNLYIKDVETTINFHHARDRIKGAPQKGIIFNYESIRSNQIFEGVIYGEEKELKNLIQTCGKNWTAHMGRSKNVQYGNVLFDIIDAKPQTVTGDGIVWEDEISLTFLSETIIYNDHGFSTTSINDLEKQLCGAKVIGAFVRTGDVENFVGVWHLKKPSERCFLAGSAFLLDVSKADFQKLAKLEQIGIGERTNEGFGWLKFGWQTEKNLKEPPVQPLKAKKPETEQPKRTKEILKSIVRETIIKKIELNSLQAQERFKRLPSNSLISRLEAMVKNNRERKNFVAALGQLRKTAKDQLGRCNNGEKTLTEFLAETSPIVKDVLSQPRNISLKNLCEETGYDPEKDSDLANQLFQRYYETFFSMMRKRSNKQD